MDQEDKLRTRRILVKVWQNPEVRIPNDDMLFLRKMFRRNALRTTLEELKNKWINTSQAERQLFGVIREKKYNAPS